MSEQINQILHNIDINNQKMNYQQQLDDIEKNYQEQINKLMQSKNKEIEELETEIKEANKTNETLVNEISKANQNNNIKIIGLTNIINSLRDELNQKEEQILILKGNSKKNEINYYKDIDEEKNMICSEYEKKISNILNISENNQEKLMNVIKEKDIIIQNLINCNQNKNKEFNEFVQKINEENKQLKNLTEQSIGLSKYNLVNSMNNNDNII
jgi:predicted RNase H-like nuclease (RuvC/YqgF family)